ncbi:MAG TPA: ATP-binding protein, partial [Rhodanobacteraceae bacterium]|nr:ATP-binding protein [Rhodanobacteraceae bacterium]
MSMRLKHLILLSHGLFLALAAVGVVACLLVVTDYAHLGREWDLWLWLAGGVLILAGVVGVALVARAIAQPLERIAGAARSLAAGRFDVRVGVAGYREANTLGANFNDMAEALAGFHALDVERVLSEQRRNETVLNSIDDGLVILDEDARVERINPIAARQFGVRVSTARGRSLDEILARDDLDAYARALMRHAPLAGRSTREFRVGAAPFDRELQCSFVPLSDGCPGMVVVVRDVTAERRFARERNEFVLRASHELRTPLTGLRMALDLLAERAQFAAGSRESELMETLREETVRLTGLLQSLLDLSRLRGGAGPMGDTCTPADATRAALRRFSARAQRQGVELVELLEGDAPELQVHEAECARVLDNLLDNALRHTPHGGRIEVSLQVDHPNDELRMCVCDNGEGIPPHHLERVFKPFVQVGDRHGGAGLGLTLCRE